MRILELFRLQAVLLNLAVRNRAAHHAARNQAVGSRRDRDRGCVRNAEVLEEGAPGTCGSVSADQRNGSHREADTRVKAEGLCTDCADQVLNDAHRRGNTEKQNDTDSALFQHAEGCHITDRAEECGHEDLLQGDVHVELHDARAAEHRMRDCEHKAADNGCRDAVATEKLNPCDQFASDEQHDDCDCERLIHIKLYCLHRNLLFPHRLRAGFPGSYPSRADNRYLYYRVRFQEVSRSFTNSIANYALCSASCIRLSMNFLMDGLPP